MAEDMDTLHWILALRWVAAARPASLDDGTRDSLRQALLEEHWADAVVDYMEHLGTVVDVYPQHDLHSAGRVTMGADELQFKPLFRDD